MRKLRNPLHSTILPLGLTVAMFATGPAFGAGTPPATSAAEVAPSPELAPGSVTADAYHAALQHLLPLSPDMIQDYQQRLDQTREAIHSEPPPQLVKATLHMSTGPGGDVPVVPITPGYVSAINFVDATGAAWPISSVSVGNPQWFNVSVLADKAGNQIVVSALGTHLASNLTVNLAGTASPLALALRTDPAHSDAVMTVRMQENGPNAIAAPLSSPEALGSSPALTQFLNDTPPQGARALTIGAPDTDAWSYGGFYYVRTRLAALWPAWDASTSLEGVTVYRMPPVTSVILSRDGQPLTASVAPATGPGAAAASGQ